MIVTKPPNSSTTGVQSPLAACQREAAAVQALGLSFANPIGLAAGLDRTGSRLGELAATGVGHVEIGTLEAPFPEVAPALAPRDIGVRVGANIGSRRNGINSQVIEDYVSGFRYASGFADYIVANLTSPHRDRVGDSPGIDRLLLHLKHVQETQAHSRRIPLLIKAGAGTTATSLPRAFHIARDLCLDGVVLVGDQLNCIEATANLLEGAALISVGGIDSREAALRRLAVADLIQVHSAFVRIGPAIVRSLLSEDAVSAS